jgi:glucosyl-3-phosphoglycerate synthase
MDYAQDSITTIHRLTDTIPELPTGDSAVVVPIAAGDEHEVTPTHIFETLASVGPTQVIVPFRGSGTAASRFREWVSEFAVETTVLWCNAPTIESLLAEYDLDGTTGKGRDVWLGLGLAASAGEYVAVHDADAATYSTAHVPRLLAPLELDHAFVKGYYARVEDNALYGRLARLFVAPLLSALSDTYDEPLLSYLSAFRYPLAGEFALTSDVARNIRAQRAWGLEIGILGEAYDIVGPDGTAQVDLGVHRHDHRPVGGRGGLATMAGEVGSALFRTLEDHSCTPDYESLPEAYRDAAQQLIRQYETDATVNGLTYDTAGERQQVETYAEQIESLGTDDRLPAWVDTDLSPEAIRTASHEALCGIQSGSV